MSKSQIIFSDFKIKSVKEDEPDFYIIVGWASIYGNVDSYDDVCEKGCFTKTLLKDGNEHPILWQHRSDKPIGLGLFEDMPEGLQVTIKLPKESDFVTKEVMPMVRIKAVKGLSIGYWTIEDKYDSVAKVNRLIELKLRETSIVTFSANPLSLITAAKHILGIEKDNSITFKSFPLADEKTKWDEVEAIKQIKANTGSTDKPSKNYDVGFMFCDSDKKEEYKSYNLPYVNYIDGEFKTVPGAIYQIAGTLGANSIDITSELKSDLKNHINSVYKKMGKVEPFQGKSFFIDTATLNNIKKSDLDVIFDNEHVTLSKNAKELVIKSLRSPGLDGSVTDERSKLLDLLKQANNI
jgi:HK97 family phage prohead protease